ncbi:hypothetical protein CF319_g1534 [Tilletia indica]|uniref:GTP-binding protein n=1 Tax=Tilletia indica TaxID=43049 RepID=A0A177TSP0_9BASI|nr:hypothetical protein CF319_g1534 [Tilletia indica]KAE8259889.1 hypothetical protein A4X13_0g708 [Tilletia indica]
MLQNNNIVVLGRRRAGKTSIIRTLADHLDPKDAVGLDPTEQTSVTHVDSILPLTFWDTPPQARSERLPPEIAHIADQTDLEWSEVCALIWVMDAQNESSGIEADAACIAADAFTHNPKISIHIFLHKIDGHSDDYTIDIKQTIEDGIDSELRFLGAPFDFKRHFHLTSIYDSSIFVAFSRVIRELLHVNTFADQLDGLCDKLNSTCSMERTYIFDVPNRIYVAADNSPSDGSSFATMSAYLTFLLQFSGIYSRLSEMVGPSGAVASANGQSNGGKVTRRMPTAGRYAYSTARLTKDISLAFWQLNDSLALVTMIRTDILAKQAGLLEYNVAFFRRGVVNLYELAQLQAPVLAASQ